VLVGLGAACSMFFAFSSSDFPVSTERSYAARSHLLRAAAGGGLGFSRSALTASVWFSTPARQVLDSLPLLHDSSARFHLVAISGADLDFSSNSCGSVLTLAHSVPIWKLIPFVRYCFTCSSYKCAGRRSRATACSASEGSCWDSVPRSQTSARQ
jgi:hypothetical protein